MLDKKPAGELNTYCSNRVNKIQEANFDVFYTNTTTNPADFVSKVKPTSAYLNTPLWKHGPKYMEEHDWMAERTIEEIQQKMSTTSEEEKIEREVKKKHKVVQLNMIQATQEQAKDNIVT